MNFNVLKYLHSLNFKSQIKLDSLAIEDLSVEIEYYLSQKNYSRYLIKKTCLKFFLSEINKKKKVLEIDKNNLYVDKDNEEQLIQERLSKIESFNLINSHKQILKDLVLGLTYEEIRKKYSLSSKQLRNLIYYFKNTLKNKT